jgi:hypothetical protein
MVMRGLICAAWFGAWLFVATDASRAEQAMPSAIDSDVAIKQRLDVAAIRALALSAVNVDLHQSPPLSLSVKN